MIRSAPKSDPDGDLEFRQLEDRLREQAQRAGRTSGPPSGLARRLQLRHRRRRTATWTAGLTVTAAVVAAMLSWHATRPSDVARRGVEPLAGERNGGIKQAELPRNQAPRKERPRPTITQRTRQLPEDLPTAIPVVFTSDDNATDGPIEGFYLPSSTRPVAREDFTPAQWQAIREVLGNEPAHSGVYPETI